MGSGKKSCCGVLVLIIVLTGSMEPSAQTQQPPAETGATAESWATQLAGLQSPPDLDVPALRQEAVARVKAKAEGLPLKRPPIASQLLTLPRLIVEIQFDEDTPIVRPESYR